MDIDAGTYLFILVIILVSFFLKQLWLSLIFLVLLVLMLVSGGKKSAKAAPSGGGGGGVKVRPIIIKRKYEGPPTYPEKMTIKYTADTPKDWYEYGTEPVGKALGSGLRWLRNLFVK
jgi:hypothetical protein